MKANHNISKIIFYGFSILCLAGIIACLICDLAINRSLTWSLYTIYSIPYLWLLSLPLTLMKRHKVELTLVVLTACAIPYLFLIDKITPVTGWFAPLGLPVATASILAIWITYGIFRFFRVNIFYKSAFTVALWGIGHNLVVDFSLASYQNAPISWWQMIIDLVIVVAATGVCCFLGYGKSHPKAAQ